jgi:hypothetical protein
MNKDNMQKVIDAIKFDGAKKFNMSVFVGKLEYEDDIVSVFENDELAHTFPVSRVRVIHEGTDLFNCTSMGCIAGFATALANDWKTPDWMRVDDPSGHLYQFENEAANYLGLSTAEAKNLFFGDDNSIWKWLMHHEAERYPNLELEDYETMQDANDCDIEWNDRDLYANFHTISYLTAVDVLTRILNEEIGLADCDNEPYYIKKEAVVS